MDPELRKMLADAHTAGASDDDLHSLIDKWNADHVGRPLQDISPQLQQQVDARQAQAAAAPEPFGTRMAREAVNIGNGFPGFARASSAMIAHQRGIPYAQAVPIQQQMTAGFGTLHRMAGGIPAAVAMAPFLPGKAAASAIQEALPTFAKWAAPSAGFLGGATFGAADQAAAPEPVSLPQRAANTVGGAAIGGVAGDLGTRFLNGIARFGGAVKANILSRSAPNADQTVVGTNTVINPALSGQRYGAAAAASAPREVTPAVNGILNDPDVQQVVGHLKSLPQYRNMDVTDPAFLTAIDQHFTDTRRAIEKGLIPTDPAKPNAKRDLIDAANTVQQKLRAAMAAPGEQSPLMFDVPAQTHSVEPIISPEREPQTGPLQEKNLSEYTSREQPTTAQLQRNYMAGDQPGAAGRQGPGGFSFRMAADPGHIVPGVDVQTPAMRVQTAPGGKPISPMMPEYLGAVGQHAEGKGLESAFQKGYDAQLANSGSGPLPFKQLATKSPAAIASESADMTPQETGQLQTGVLSALKEQPGRRKMVLPSIESYRAAGLLRAAQGKTTTPQMSDYLRNLLMGTANSPFANP